MSTDISLSPHPKFQGVSVNGSSSDSKSIEFSSATDIYKDLIHNPEIFWKKLNDFLENSDKNVKIPIVGGNSLDLHKLFIEVTSRGGIEQVIKDRKCKEVIGAFNFKIKITNAAYVLRKYYVKLLFEFEHVYYFQEPISSFWAREEALKRLVEKSADHDNGTLKPGLPVNGVIGGKFDDGYFVTIKVGSEELKGVLYHIPPAPAETRRHRKKPKVDAGRPKFHRSGYNFFFSEHYARLKPNYVGKERALIKEIGNMWSNLSESDREVYQAKGFEDVERYKTEMSEYKSSIRSCAVENVAATDEATAVVASASEIVTEADQ